MYSRTDHVKFVKDNLEGCVYAIGVALVCLLLTLNIFSSRSSLSIVNFEQVNAD